MIIGFYLPLDLGGVGLVPIYFTHQLVIFVNMNTLGRILRFTSYGESHGEVVGGVLDGFPSGFELDLNAIQIQMDRRRPGQSELTTSRNEDDKLHINSGVYEGKTLGSPIHFYLKNKDKRSQDYDALKEVYRPSHADYTYERKYGHRDHRGGGRSSARVTAAWVAAGAMAEQFLAAQGIFICSYVHSIGECIVEESSQFFIKEEVDATAVRCPFLNKASEMQELIEKTRVEKDSLGGVIQTVVKGMPVGLGEPVFEKLSAKLGQALLSINAVKGVEFGGGFDMAKRKGSEVNDAFTARAGRIETSTNYSGGLQGGISNGMNLEFKLAFKPTASIGLSQDTITKDLQEVKLETHGRHDPCVLPRAVPIVEAMTALVLMDAFLIHS